VATLRQQIVQDRTDDTAKILGFTDKDMAFLRLAHSIITGTSIHAFDDADLVDGGQDKQVDMMTIEQGDDEASIYIIQGKNTHSFSSNALIQLRNGLHWVFNKSKADLVTLGNKKFQDKIFEYRSTVSGLGPANIRVVVAFVTNGVTAKLSDEFMQEAKTIREEYDNDTFESFELLIYGCDELVRQINTAEKKNKKINAKIKIRYDKNNPSLIKYHSEGLKGVVCSARGRDIARIVNNDTSGFVFDSNIRRFLGGRGAVNLDIRKTCTDKNSSHLFWFLNNGITIACDSFDPVTDPDNAHIKIKNIQIVNGCQTATTLALAAKDKALEADVYVLLRIYEAPVKLVDRIVLTTNNQNKISSRDLRSNDQVQIAMQQRFERFNLYYERKVRQFDKIAGVDASRIAPNEIVAQSYLAVVLKKPSDARRRKYRVWGDLYDKIFSGDTAIEPYVISFQLHRLAALWLRASGNTAETDDLTRRLAKNGVFHIARIAAFNWRGGDDWVVKEGDFAEQITSLEKKPKEMDAYFKAALDTFKKLVHDDPKYASDIDGAMKSTNLDEDIDRVLHGSKLSAKSTKVRRATAPKKKKKAASAKE
jgi:hypothetical protein